MDTQGVSGNEKEVRQLVKDRIEEHADTVETDSFGNLVARKGSGDRTLMVAAHMDQIGLAVKRLGDDGFIRVAKVGGIYPRDLLDQRFTVHASEGEDLPGVTSTKPVHLLEEKEREEVPDLEDICIDVGARSSDELHELGVRVGDFISFRQGLEELENGYITAPAFDDRAGCAVLIEAFRQFSEDYELVAVFTAQEETGLKGARTSAFGVDPDVMLAVDVGIAGDSPGIEEDESSVETGEGLTIDMLQQGGRGLITPENVREWLLKAAEGHSFQRKVDEGGRTDAAATSLVREGVPAGSIGIPANSIHSSVETVKLSDLEEAKEFLLDAFREMEGHF